MASEGDLLRQWRNAFGQQVGQIARARRPCVVPAVGRRHGDDAVRDQDGGAYDALAEDRPVHDQRQGHAQHELDRHRDDGDRQGDGEGRPPVPVTEDGRVVGEPDEGGVVGGAARL